MTARLERIEQAIDCDRGGDRAHLRGPAVHDEAAVRRRDAPPAGRRHRPRAGAHGERRAPTSVATVLIVDDEPNIRRMVGALLAAEGYEVRDAASGAHGIARAAEDEPDVVLLDLMMPGELDGMATLARLQETHSRPAGDHDERPRRTERRGQRDEARRGQLSREAAHARRRAASRSASALELRQSRRVARELREELGLAGEMVGESPQMKRVRELIDACRRQRRARADHRRVGHGKGARRERDSRREHAARSAVRPRELRGDSARPRRERDVRPREGRVHGRDADAASAGSSSRNTGTLFLDEVGDLSADAQAKLLRAIEAREIQRVGGSKPIRVDVRIIAATNQDLDARGAGAARFREDLFFRLNVIPLALPPLREREGDVPAARPPFLAAALQAHRQLPPAWTPERARRAGALSLAGQRARAGEHRGAPFDNAAWRRGDGRTSSGCAAASRLERL